MEPALHLDLEARKSKLGPHGQVKCLSCCKVFRSYSSLEAHLKSKHEGENSEWRRLHEAKTDAGSRVDKKNKSQFVLGDLIKISNNASLKKSTTATGLSAYYREKSSRGGEAVSVRSGRLPSVKKFAPKSSGATSKALVWRATKPKKVKLTNLKKIILREREARRLRAQHGEIAPTPAADGITAEPRAESACQSSLAGQSLPNICTQEFDSGGQASTSGAEERGAYAEGGDLAECADLVDAFRLGEGGSCAADSSTQAVGYDAAAYCEREKGNSVRLSANLVSTSQLENATEFCRAGPEVASEQHRVEDEVEDTDLHAAVTAEDTGCEQEKVESGEGHEDAYGGDDAGNGLTRRCRRRRRRHKSIQADSATSVQVESPPRCCPGERAEDRVQQAREVTFLTALKGTAAEVRAACSEEQSGAHRACNCSGCGESLIGSTPVDGASASFTDAPLADMGLNIETGKVERRSRRGRHHKKERTDEGSVHGDLGPLTASSTKEMGLTVREKSGNVEEEEARGCASSGSKGAEEGRDRQAAHGGILESGEGQQGNPRNGGALGQVRAAKAKPPPTAAATYIGPGVEIRYCKQVISMELNHVTLQVLQELARFQERARNKDPLKAKQRQRLMVGMREVSRSLRMQRAKCIIVAPNIEEVKSEGGLDDLLGGLLEQAEANHVSIVFALTRSRIAQALGHRKVKMSCVAICDYDGANQLYKEMLNLAQRGREEWAAVHIKGDKD